MVRRIDLRLVVGGLLILSFFFLGGGKVDLGENGTPPLWDVITESSLFSWFKNVCVSIISIFLKSQVSSFQLS